MEPIQVRIQQGLLRGKTDVDLNGRPYFAFLGIPYAKPPIANLRFQPPEAPDSWLDVRDATADGNPCYSRDFIPRTIVGSEDCLYLNVYTPELPKEEKMDLKPVMVYIHGGAFTSGSNSSEILNPHFLLTDDVVLVTINYRLGLLGFLAFEDPKLKISGNAGLKDMVMALKWVQSNIAKFSGDSNNVTIFGNSAGAAAVHFLVLSKMAKGLFHKAIAQSGSALNCWALAKPSAIQLAQILNCPYTDETDILQYLQELPVQKILEGQDKIIDEFHAGFVRSIGPIIEKIETGEGFLVENPLDLISRGDYNQVPMIFGYTSREGMFLEMLEKKWNSSMIINDFENVIPNQFHLAKGSELSKEIAHKIKEFYFGSDPSSYKDKQKHCLLHSDTLFTFHIYNSAKAQANSSKEPVYLYRFSLDARLNFYKKTGDLELPGASHADELGYLFKTPITPEDLDPNGIELKTVRRMVRLWTNFAKTGNPNPVEKILWKPISREEVNFLNVEEELVTGVNPDEKRMKFWDNVSETILKN